ncbi:GNAT family protein [Pelagibacterium sp. H642]|uniref:GNAT family N-acetyltransferase n=1 Tax=Pelagibacterium sp. H642 TaxID=1881069 RepID=UPI002814CD2C|nr:GNAT family protein [Pelagibacterium sp. H642]WMT92543.1 GNAT family N-acetyltransferase [Pelagibacterium sp. H642]
MIDPFSAPLPIPPGHLITCDYLEHRDLLELERAAAYPEIWQHMVRDASTPMTFKSYSEELLALRSQRREIPFVIRKDGAAIGVCKLMQIDVQQERLSMGGTWITPSAWGTGVNTDVRRIIFSFAFDVIEANRVEIRVYHDNPRNLAALEKIGAVYEGMLREHFIDRNNRRRDVAVFSVLKREWAAVSKRLLARLSSQLGGAPVPLVPVLSTRGKPVQSSEEQGIGREG